MLTLGDVLAFSRAPAADLGSMALSPVLLSDLRAAAAAEGVTPERFVRMAVASFAEEAGPDDWTTLMSLLRDTPDPGAACLQMMVERRLPSSGAFPSSEPAEEVRADAQTAAETTARRAGPRP